MNMDGKQKLIVAFGIGATLISASVAAYQLYVKSSPRKRNSKQLVKSWKAVGTVTALHIFPIKSCQGIQVEEAEAHAMGLTNGDLQDRSFMVINENNNFLHARIHPSMVLIKVSISDGGQVELTGPNMELLTFPIPDQSKNLETKVRIWGDEVTAYDCGDKVAQWLSRYIFQKETGARLVHLGYTAVSPRAVKPKMGHLWMEKTDGSVFNDLTPFHLLSTESAGDLSSRVDGGQVTTLQFRPTITISGCQPYEEDEWRFVRIGDAVFRYVKGCDRCLLTTIDPTTGVKHPDQEPLRTLRKYRLAKDPVLRKAIGESPLLGINLSLEQPGKIRVGDVVYAGQL